MKLSLSALCGVILGLSIVFMAPVTASDLGQTNKGETTQPTTRDEPPKAVHENEPDKEKIQPQQKSPRATNNVPIYKPPLRGAPAGRVAGGTRGPDPKLPYLCLIVPEHIGLTVSRQPVLFFYQSKASSCPVEFTLIQKQGILPIVEARIAPRGKPGIQPVRLADHGVYLEPNIQYKWFIALVPDAQHRSKDILAAGGIEFIEQQPKIKQALAKAPMSQVPHIYAEAGIWYDAFNALCSLIETSPDDSGLKLKQAALLEQIGLAGIIGHGMTE